MEHHSHGTQTQGLRSHLTDMSMFPQQAQAQLLSFQPGVQVGQLCSEPNWNQQDDGAGPSGEVANGRKRRGRMPTQNPQEKRVKKNEADRKYRQNLKVEFEELRAMRETASEFGGVENMKHMINQMEAELQRLRGMLPQNETELEKLEQMKHKFGGIEEMESKLLRLEQIDSMFQRNIHGIVSEIERLRSIEIELQQIKCAQMESHLNQQQDYHGIQSVNLNNRVQGSKVDLLEFEIKEMFPAAQSGAMPDLMYSDTHVTEFIAKLDENVLSSLCLCGFNDLHGDCQIVGDCTFPSPLLLSVNDIFNDHRDALLNCGLSANFLENISVSFFGAFNEMRNLSLQQIDEEIILKLRDKIKDAILIDCSLKFALDHLKKIAYAYFGLKARNDPSIVEKRLADLMAEEKLLRGELENKVNEVNAMNAKNEQLTSPLCKNCLGCAHDFLNGNIYLC